MSLGSHKRPRHRFIAAPWATTTSDRATSDHASTLVDCQWCPTTAEGPETPTIGNVTVPSGNSSLTPARDLIGDLSGRIDHSVTSVGWVIAW